MTARQPQTERGGEKRLLRFSVNISNEATHTETFQLNTTVNRQQITKRFCQLNAQAGRQTDGQSGTGKHPKVQTTVRRVANLEVLDRLELNAAKELMASKCATIDLN